MILRRVCRSACLAHLSTVVGSHASRSASTLAGLPPAPPSGSHVRSVAPDVSQTVARLPQRLAGGSFECLYCEEPTVHHSRDRLLVHISESHPEVDFDTVEEHIPPRVIVPAQRLTPSESIVVPKAPIPSGPTPRRSSPPVAPAPKGSGKLLEVTFADDCFPCELCGREYGSEGDLLRHLESAHPDGTAESSVAPDLQEEDIALRRLQAEESRKAAAEEKESGEVVNSDVSPTGAPKMAVVCDLCAAGQGKVFTTTSALFAHIKSKHVRHSATEHTRRMIKDQAAVAAFVCPECSKGFATALALEGHVQSKHRASPDAGPSALVAMNQAWWCHECERGFGSPQALHGHMTTKHDLPSSPYPCPACKRIFSDVYSLKSHISLQHKNIDANDIKAEDHASCPECMRQFIGEKNLDLHWKKHHKAKGERPKDTPNAPKARATRIVSSARLQSAAAELESVLTHDITAEVSAPESPIPTASEDTSPAAADSDEEKPRAARIVVRRKLRGGEEEDQPATSEA